MENSTVKIKPTSNPAIIKFEASRFLTEHTSYEYRNIDEARDSPLAQQLFYLPFVKTVFISGNFVAIERYDIVAWEDVREEVAAQIANYLESGRPVVKEAEAETRLPYTIYAESTPNPAVLKFVANKKLVSSTFEFKNIDEAKDAPLAQSLFHFPFVREVFIDENYISITKYDIADWNDITMELREYIRVYLEEGKPVVSDTIQTQKTNKSAIAPEADNSDIGETSREIIGIIEEYVKPAVASDGGNILFESYDEESKVVKLVLQGACSGCPSSTFTLKNGIETMLKEMLHGKVNEVVAING
ncbi:NifU family protein [Sinomicrobium soli]|uniref:NifU family protein n=1 Tax=Sinomicrobium sp. N-1-3-6 TaxID=2219864 RepID=UPI000DCD464A|nr:NifU family protein [Sinomicrobium sp. N-1-3-6]RAV30715.1 NifU family protein [Sinomicrobium sp. N-1-3-6]